jgi:hypothetical protein
MGDTNRVGLIYVPELTLGTTPVNSTGWKTMRFTSESLLPNYSTKQSEQIRSDRMRGDVVQTSASVGGGINFELSGTTLDDFMQAVLGGTWTSNVLKVGTTKRSFSFEKSFNDLATGNKFEQYKGMRIGELTLALAYDEIAKGTMTFAGTAIADSATSIVGSGTVAAASTTEPFNSTLDVIEVEIDGIASTLYFQSLNLSLNANLRAKTAIGGLFPYDQGYGSAGVELSASCYFDNRSLEDKVRSGAPFTMGFKISDGTYAYEVLIPRAYAASRSGNAATGLDADVLQELTISGAFDSASASSIVITRTVP